MLASTRRTNTTGLTAAFADGHGFLLGFLRSSFASKVFRRHEVTYLSLIAFLIPTIRTTVSDWHADSDFMPAFKYAYAVKSALLSVSRAICTPVVISNDRLYGVAFHIVLTTEIPKSNSRSEIQSRKRRHCGQCKSQQSFECVGNFHLRRAGACCDRGRSRVERSICRARTKTVYRFFFYPWPWWVAFSIPFF